MEDAFPAAQEGGRDGKLENKMCEIVIFAGTTEGRELAQFLSRHQVDVHVCAATEYGGELLRMEHCTVHAGRLDAAQMRELFRQLGEDVLVVDATHPYAAEASANIRKACEGCAAYLRLLRESSAAAGDDIVPVASVQEAVDFLAGTQGNILVTTGSKELGCFMALPGYRTRVYARVLSAPEAVSSCAALGFAGKHLICMQGPFSEELNLAMLRQFDAKWLVTKESGRSGGFEEKLRAAKRAGARVVLIGRPTAETGMSPSEVRAYLIETLGIKVKRRIAVVGIGMGDPGGLTREAYDICRNAQLLVGAQRMLEPFADLPGEKFVSYRPEEIRNYLEAHPQYETVALLQSGDVGFYSGARKLCELFAEEELQVYPGISSVAYLCARLRVPWEDVKLVSLHGRNANIVAIVREHKRVFAIIGKGQEAGELLEKFACYHMDDVRVTVAENLSYETEKITAGTVRELAGRSFSDLCVILIENPDAHPVVTHGIGDEAFLRDKVPMTKSEVRSISLSKLRLCRDSVVYDVGAGTGSVSIETALQAADGWVYAVEKKEEALRLIRENQRKFAADNLTVVPGSAPEALSDLPVPTHAFIGGSSGNLREITETILRRNPCARVVVNCIALETLSEALECLRTLPVTEVDITAVTVAKSKEAGSYHMMMGQNPVYIISFTGSGRSAENGMVRRP